MKNRHDLWTCADAGEFRGRVAALGLDCKTLLEQLTTQPQQACLVVCGSIAERIGNAESDIDMLLLVDSMDQLKEGGDIQWSFSTGEAYKPATLKLFMEGVEFDIEVCTLDQTGALQKSIEDLLRFMETAAGDSRIPRLQPSDVRFLHHIKSAWVLENAGAAQRWRQKLHVQYLPIYSMVACYVEYMEHFEDVVSALNRADLLDVANIGRICSEDAAQTLLAIAGNTNPNRKWIAHLLRNVGQERPEFKQLTENSIRLLFPSICKDLDGATQYVNQLKDIGHQLRSLMDRNPMTKRVLDTLFSKLHYVI